MNIAVVGAHLTGLPLNTQLTALGATLVRKASTAPKYKFFALPNTEPLKPGLVRVDEAQDNGIELEVWDLPGTGWATFIEGVPPPLCIGSVELDDGTIVKGFLCESYAIIGAADITHLGGWRAYLASLR